MQKQVFTGKIYPAFYTRCQNVRPLVSSWEVGIITCKILQVINKRSVNQKALLYDTIGAVCSYTRAHLAYTTPYTCCVSPDDCDSVEYWLPLSDGVTLLAADCVSLTSSVAAYSVSFTSSADVKACEKTRNKKLNHHVKVAYVYANKDNDDVNMLINRCDSS